MREGEEFHDDLHGRLTRFIEEMVSTFYWIETAHQPVITRRGETTLFKSSNSGIGFHITVGIVEYRRG
jgi:hypothetical protein